ncbi:hypothetical protein FOPG_04546 [Fusarium oxysporum f. sp. conglutinans race 2 54008]|uniref:Uncharacterized protein n=2 Tax=Fusarium oxysporum TaxID=5507 RepID=X0IFR1_FUSOX|nr:hypothetical protein FOVG_15930 [Fusarium oxysporum f. sp. pisi HDV247]EXL82735.1 hypothetical protein FOPG_04546 [Fusarium oxysporum f. sp. conglutinans race 2 54008]
MPSWDLGRRSLFSPIISLGILCIRTWINEAMAVPPRVYRPIEGFALTANRGLQVQMPRSEMIIRADELSFNDVA